MIIVHHLENSRSQRVLWLLEELAVPYEIKNYQRDKKTMLAPASLKAVHPLGKSPVITDAGKTIAESGAITEYLIHHYGPDSMKFDVGSEAWLQGTYWSHFAEGTAMPFPVMKLVFSQIKRAPMPFFVKPVAGQIVNKVMSSFLQPNIDNTLAYINDHLQGKTWFVDETLSAADFQMSFPLLAAATREDIPAQYPNIQRYLERMQQRPAFQKAIEKGGPLQVMS